MKLSSKFYYYAALGFLPPFIQSLSELDKAKMDSMLWPQWVVLILMPTYSMLLGLKALMSYSPAKAPDNTTTTVIDNVTTVVGNTTTNKVDTTQNDQG
jgi:hypothetical protein